MRTGEARVLGSGLGRRKVKKREKTEGREERETEGEAVIRDWFISEPGC